MEKKNNFPLEPRSGSILIAMGFNPRSVNGERNYAFAGMANKTLGQQLTNDDTNR